MTQKEATSSTNAASSSISPGDQTKISQKILENLFNYALSFAKPVTVQPTYFGAQPTTVER